MLSCENLKIYTDRLLSSTIGLVASSLPLPPQPPGARDLLAATATVEAALQDLGRLRGGSGSRLHLVAVREHLACLGRGLTYLALAAGLQDAAGQRQRPEIGRDPSQGRGQGLGRVTPASAPLERAFGEFLSLSMKFRFGATLSGMADASQMAALLWPHDRLRVRALGQDMADRAQARSCRGDPGVALAEHALSQQLIALPETMDKLGLPESSNAYPEGIMAFPPEDHRPEG